MDRIQKWIAIVLVVLYLPVHVQLAEAAHNSRKGMYNNTLDLSTISNQYSYSVSITPEKPKKDDELTITIEVKNLDTLELYNGKVEWTLQRDGLFGLKDVLRTTTEPFDLEHFPGTHGVKYVAEKGGSYLLEFNVEGKEEWASVEFEVEGESPFDWKIALMGFPVLLFGVGGIQAWRKKKSFLDLK